MDAASLLPQKIRVLIEIKSQHLSNQVELSEDQMNAGICTSEKLGLESTVQGGECTMFVDEVIG